MIEHKPDLKPRALSLGPFSTQTTPSRRQGDHGQSSLGGRQVDIRDKSVVSTFDQESLEDLTRRAENLSMGAQNLAPFGRPASYLGPGGVPAFPAVSAQLTFPHAPGPLFMGPPYPPATPNHMFYTQGQANFSGLEHMSMTQFPAPYAHYGQIPTPDSIRRTGSPKNRIQQHRNSYNQTPFASNRGSNSNFRNHRPPFQKHRHHKNDKDSEHNIVRVEAIQMGIDVRTTVSCSPIWHRETPANISIGDASKHPQQAYPKDASANHQSILLRPV